MATASKKVENEVENAAGKAEDKVETAAEKIENKVYSMTGQAAGKIEEAADKAESKLRSAGTAVQDYFSVLNRAGRAAFEGTVEVDRLILSKLGDSVRDTVGYGREILSARDVKTAVSIYVNFVQARVNKTHADTKEVLDLAKDRADDMIEPFKAYA